MKLIQKIVFIIYMILFVVGCSDNPNTIQIVVKPTPQVPTASPSPQVSAVVQAQPTVVSPVAQTRPTEVETLVQEYNDWRFVNGQNPIVNGLNCSLYNLSPTPIPVGPPVWYRPSAFPTSLPSSSANFGYIGVFNQENISLSQGINVLPEALRTQYTQWYAIRCFGYIVVTDNNYYNYELTSDDASLLYIDGILVVDNDGSHATQTRSGTKLLQKGVHSFRLDYMSASGQQSLILTSRGTVVPSEQFYR